MARTRDGGLRTGPSIFAGAVGVEGGGPASRQLCFTELDFADVRLGGAARRHDRGAAAAGEGEREEGGQGRFGIDKHGKLVYP